MEITKRLTRARHLMMASPGRAPAVKRSLIETLGRLAVHAPDAVTRSDARRALDVLRDGDWGDAAWAELGVPLRTSSPRPLALPSIPGGA